jgi:hypothetical protein
VLVVQLPKTNHKTFVWNIGKGTSLLVPIRLERGGGFSRCGVLVKPSVIATLCGKVVPERPVRGQIQTTASLPPRSLPDGSEE